MSHSLRYRVVQGQQKGWFNVIDSKDGSIVHEIRGLADANTRARGLNRAEDAKPKATPVSPSLLRVICEQCPATIYIRPGGSTVCPKCRAEAEAIIEFNETRDAQFKAAEEELMEASYRRVLVPAFIY